MLILRCDLDPPLSDSVRTLISSERNPFLTCLGIYWKHPERLINPRGVKN